MRPYWNTVGPQSNVIGPYEKTAMWCLRHRESTMWWQRQGLVMQLWIKGHKDCSQAREAKKWEEGFFWRIQRERGPANTLFQTLPYRLWDNKFLTFEFLWFVVVYYKALENCDWRTFLHLWPTLKSISRALLTLTLHTPSLQNDGPQGKWTVVHVNKIRSIWLSHLP